MKTAEQRGIPILIELKHRNSPGLITDAHQNPEPVKRIDIGVRAIRPGSQKHHLCWSRILAEPGMVGKSVTEVVVAGLIERGSRQRVDHDFNFLIDRLECLLGEDAVALVFPGDEHWVLTKRFWRNVQYVGDVIECAAVSQVFAHILILRSIDAEHSHPCGSDQRPGTRRSWTIILSQDIEDRDAARGFELFHLLKRSKNCAVLEGELAQGRNSYSGLGSGIGEGRAVRWSCRRRCQLQTKKPGGPIARRNVAALVFIWHPPESN